MKKWEEPAIEIMDMGDMKGILETANEIKSTFIGDKSLLDELVEDIEELQKFQILTGC